VEVAVGLGLVDEVADDAYETATHKLHQLAALPRSAYVAAKRAVRPPLMPTEEQERKLRAVLASWTSPEMHARVRAVLAR
jgi:enoyl-CoA hydratase/carnithine racemase